MLISWNEFWCSSSADVWCWIMLVSVGELEIKCIYLESKAENSIGNSTIKCHYLIPESSSSSSSVLDTSSSQTSSTHPSSKPWQFSFFCSTASTAGHLMRVHNNRTLSQSAVELQTKVRKDFSITEKASIYLGLSAKSITYGGPCDLCVDVPIIIWAFFVIVTSSRTFVWSSSQQCNYLHSWRSIK